MAGSTSPGEQPHGLHALQCIQSRLLAAVVLQSHGVILQVDGLQLPKRDVQDGDGAVVTGEGVDALPKGLDQRDCLGVIGTYINAEDGHKIHQHKAVELC